MVALSAADNFQTLKLHVDPRPGGDKLGNIAQVLSVGQTYECLEYLPDRSRVHFNLSAPALDLLSRTQPMISRLVIDLGDFIGYSPSWDQAYKAYRRATETRYFPADSSYVDGLDIICAVARFKNLRDLTLHYKLHHDQVALMHPNPGCEVARELFESIQRRKRGQALVRFNLIFYTNLIAIFGSVNYRWCTGPTISTTMTVIFNDDISSQGSKQPQCNCICDNPKYGKAIERRKRADKIYGDEAWTYRLGSIQYNLIQGRFTKLPWNIVVESLMCLALLPSYFVFEEGKHAQFEPSLANVVPRYHRDYSGRRMHFRGRLFRLLLPH